MRCSDRRLEKTVNEELHKLYSTPSIIRTYTVSPYIRTVTADLGIVIVSRLQGKGQFTKSNERAHCVCYVFIIV